MSQINILDTNIANQIAAGEVVERPASVVKELVENSLDAHATNIEIRVEGAGKTLINIKDNGDGMDEEDVKLSFKRHATSKIKGPYDLFRIKTLGFRGEAIPSIASVSEMTITSAKDEQVGTSLKYSKEGEYCLNHTPSRVGTTVSVRDLFFNTPARLKYLKSNSIENANITETVSKLALGNTSVAFDYYLEQKKIFTTSGKNNLLETIAEIYGSDAAKKMRKIKIEQLGYEIEGYIGIPEMSKASRYFIFTFLNTRSVYMNKISKCINDAYKDFIPIGRFPFVVLNFKVDYALVDVNVHPTKREVRLSIEEDICRTLKEKIVETLRSDAPVFSTNSLYKAEEVQPVLTDFSKNIFAESLLDENNELAFKEPVVENIPLEVIKPAVINEVVETPHNESNSLFSNVENKIFNLQAVGQILDSYIVATSNDDMYLIDQHAANERINFEKFEKLYFADFVFVKPLIPLMIDIGKEFISQFDDNHKLVLKEIGFDVELFGESTLVIREYPSFFDFSKDLDLLMDLIERVLKDETVDIVDIKRYAIASVSCKASIKANHSLSIIEQNLLLENLLKCQNPRNCPHGRPIMIKISKYEIERMFKRK